MTTSDSSKVTVTVRGDADVHVTPRAGGAARPPSSAAESVASEDDFDSKDAALAAAHQQGRHEAAVYHEKGRWHVAKEDTVQIVLANLKPHEHASRECAAVASDVKTVSRHVHWKQDHGIFIGKGQLTGDEYLVEPQREQSLSSPEPRVVWVLYLIRKKARGRRELVYIDHSSTISRVMLKADESETRKADVPSAAARELVTAAADAPTSREQGAYDPKLAPGYYAIAPDGSVMSGPFDTYSPAKQAASRLNGYVRFAAEHAAGEDSGGRGGYCIPYIRMVRDADAYEQCIGAWNKGGRRIATARDVYDALHDKLAKEDQEVFLVMLVDVRGQCIGVDEVARGARDRVDVDIARVFASVAVYRPHHYIVVHNHPSRKANPSQADKDLTKTIEEASQPFARSSAFVDHVVIGMGEYYSFADGKLHRVSGKS
jgi:hypothetical protein